MIVRDLMARRLEEEAVQQITPFDPNNSPFWKTAPLYEGDLTDINKRHREILESEWVIIEDDEYSIKNN